MLVVALLGIPMLIGMWYAVRAFANVERAVASTLLDEHVDQRRWRPASAATSGCGSAGNEPRRARWRELGYLLLRFPAGIATFTLAVTALTVPVMIAYTPISARFVDESTSRSATGSGAPNCRTSRTAIHGRGHCSPPGWCCCSPRSTRSSARTRRRALDGGVRGCA